MTLRLLESTLYCDDLGRASRFYVGVLGLRVVSTSERLVALDAGPQALLLLFRRGAAAAPAGGRELPAHDGAGSQHLAFAVTAAELSAWEGRLAAAGVPIEQRRSWDRGGISVSFRDPDGHLVELATPGVWETY